MSDRKNGIPINAVTMPIGKTAPWTIDLLMIEAADNKRAPKSAVKGMKNR
jgi:hypothetical protein